MDKVIKFSLCLPHFHHLVSCYPFSSFASTAFIVFGGLFHWCVVPDTEFGAYNRTMCLQKLPKQFSFKH